MTTFEDMHGHGRTGAGFVTVTQAISRRVAWVRRRMEIARCERHLHEMPDNMLRDIGMHRSEISGVVRYGRTEYGR
jgi:uncharacterized protein YjiS (DUF1127 family)